jgi:hypothetical protein
MIKVVKEYFAPEIEKTRRFLEHDENINFIRSAWMMLAPFEQFFGERRNIEAVMTSGLGYRAQNHELLKRKFKTVIPSYSYFAFGDALGKYANGNLDYYPAFPYTMYMIDYPMFICVNMFIIEGINFTSYVQIFCRWIMIIDHCIIKFF